MVRSSSQTLNTRGEEDDVDDVIEEEDVVDDDAVVVDEVTARLLFSEKERMIFLMEI